MKKILCTAVALAALVCAQPSHAGFGISPRVALPLGDFGDTVGMGFGASVVTDTPVRGGLSFLTFGEGDFGSATAMGVFAGYERQVGGVDVKIDANLMRITTEIEVFGISVEETETKIKITPGVSYTMGKLAAEIDYDLAGDWAGINLYYSLGE
ncbi:MAG: hypothetical protein ACPGRY_02310 [Candidatus Latescibacterota bacterium]